MTDLVHATTDTQDALDAGRALAQPLDVNGTPALMVPKGGTAALYPDLRDMPQRIKQTLDLHDAGSFIDYVNGFGTSDLSAIFCDRRAARFIAILDYHADRTEPGWCQHIARFTARETVEWAAWKKANGVKMDQVQFAYFIEERLPEIVDPVGADMLEIALSLRAKTKLTFERGARLDNGQTQLTYREEIDGSAGPKGQLRIPETIKLGVRLFEGGEAYEIEARFRYRIHEGELTMWYDLVRPHRVHEDAVDQIAKTVRESTTPNADFYFGATGA